MSSLVQASVVATGQVQSLDSVRTHALPSDALIFASPSLVTPTNQNLGSYAIVESGVNSLGVTTTGSVPAVTQSPFADLYKEGSIYFNGTAGNYLQNTATYSNSTIQWNTAGMTIEAWVNYPTFTGASAFLSTNPQPVLFGQMIIGAANNYWSFGSNTTGYVNFYYWNGSSQTVMSTTPLSTNTWNHIAMTCSTSGQIFLFVNGVQTTVITNRNGTFTGTTNYETAQGTPQVTNYPLTIGQYNGINMNAYVSDLRLTTGTPVYTGSTSSLATFTVPSAPLSSTTSPGVTQFLLRAGSNAPYVSNGALTFDRGLRQYANFGPLTLNPYTRGFSVVFRYTWNGIVANNERILQFTQSTSSPNNSLAILRNGTGSSVSFSYYNNSGTPTTVTTTGTLSQSVTYVLALVYSTSGAIQWWVNGAPNASGTLSLSADPTLFPYTFMGCDYSGAGSFTSMTSNTFAVYNRALSNVEIYNSYLALTTTPVGRTLEIGDVNGTPALSVAGDGKVFMDSVGLTSNVLPWPPAAMTGYDTVINGGVYKARASNENGSQYAWLAFDQNSSTYWLGSGTYNSATGFYTGTASTTDVNGTVYSGEWCQIQLPTPVLPVSFYNLSTSSAPNSWVVLGSRDGVNFSLIQTVTNDPGGGRTNTASSVNSFLYFRWVIIKSTVGVATPSFFTLQVNGTADTSPTLTIAPATTFNTSVATPSLTGIAGSAFVPQDFSSSGLNIPAYVVSNTATVANTVAFSSFGPFAGEGSFQFNGGTQGYINFPSSVTSLNSNIWSSPTTIEMWVYPTAAVTVTPFITRGAGGVWDWWLWINSGGTLVLQYGVNSAGQNQTVAGGTVAFNTWNHIAMIYNGTNVMIAVNGVNVNNAGVVASNLTYTSTYSVQVGSGFNVYQCNGYISNLRIVRGQALYTATTFTPPTQSLQPIQGVTQAGLPYGTVLLLRNAPAPGRIQTTKFSGANSGTVLSFPPAAMTGYSTALSSGYGQGTYVASASSEATAAWYAFDKAVGSGSTSYWSSAGSTYNTSTGYVATTVTTVDVNGNSYAGEWLQVQMPASIVLSSYSLQARGDSFTQTPVNFWVLGSRDGINWFLVDSRTAVSWTVNSQIQAFNTTSTQAFTWYRLVVNRITAPSAVTSTSEWTLNGSIESVNINPDGRVGLGVVNPTRALEVAGDVVCAGTLSAGNPLMFRNRIINGNFNVWQRGTIFTASANTYTADRWVTPTNTVTTITATQSTNVPFRAGFQYSLSLATATTTNNPLIEHRFEQLNTYDLYQGTSITISFWMRQTVGGPGTMNIEPLLPSGVNTFTGYTDACTPSLQQIQLSSNWQYYTLTFSISVTGVATNGLAIQWWQAGPTNPATILITGVQLEKGTLATPFEVRPYGVELQLCQRYYVRFTADGVYKPLGTAYVYSASACQGVIVAPTSMRAQPSTIDISSSSNTCAYTSSMIQGTTVSTTNDVYIYSGAGTNYGFTTIGGTGNGVASLSWNLIGITLSGGSGLTTGWAGMMYMPTGKYIGFSSEL